MLKRLLSELADVGVRSVAFSGGEPLIRKDLSELFLHGKEAGITDFGLVTNGYFASMSRARELTQAGLRTVQISVDGVDAIDHCAVRGCEPSDFYRALRAIRYFKDCGAKVYVAAILSPRNVKRAPEMAMFCQALAVDGLRYCTFVPKGRATNAEQVQAYTIAPAELDEHITFVQKLNADPAATLSVTIDHAIGPWSQNGEFHCVSGKGVAYISAEGDLFPCPSLLAEPFRVGNVFDSPIRELLASASMSAVRHISRKQLQGFCATCSNKACNGGCRGVAFAYTGDVHGALPYCNFCRVGQKCH
jgi:radical SAM protein with 4Fe4S-binding SPASM domain